MPVEDITPPKLAEQQNQLPVKKRSKGEITREKILIAAIDILALNGIKGTTHRAIASHADLQLSLTTYSSSLQVKFQPYFIPGRHDFRNNYFRYY